MLVERVTWIIKPGHIDEFGALAKATLAQAGLKNVMRVYRIKFGEHDRIAIEIEHESMAARETWWNGWRTSDGAAAWEQQANALRAAGAPHEFWILVN